MQQLKQTTIENWIEEGLKINLEKIGYYEQLIIDIQENNFESNKLFEDCKDYLIQCGYFKNIQQIKQWCDEYIENMKDELKILKNNESEESEEEQEDGNCEMCFTFEKVTLHHAIPKLILKRLRKKNKEAPVIYIKLCRYCHSYIHKTFTHKQLATSYFKIDQLLEAKELQNYIEDRRNYVQKQF